MKLGARKKLAANPGSPGVMYVLTSSLAVRFLTGQLRFLREAGYDVSVVSSPGEELASICKRESVRAVAIPMAREISLFKDLVSLWRLWRLMRRLRPSITNVGTPKAGLLGGLASVLARVPCRIYTLHGLRLETLSGFRRHILILAEKISCWSAHRILCVSPSLRKKAIALGLCGPGRAKVIHCGSCNGVEVSQFSVDAVGGDKVLALRNKLQIPQAAPVVGFVGRLTRDKGILELLEAFESLRARWPELRLLLVGDFEDGDKLRRDVRLRIKTDPNIVAPGSVANPAPYYHLINLLALPTYREGFPYAVLEAGAAGKPSVVTAATGAVDSVIDGLTGLVVHTGDADALAAAIVKLIEDPSRAAEMGSRAKERVAAEFQPQRIWAELAAEYGRLLAARGLSGVAPRSESAEHMHIPESEFATSCMPLSKD